MVVCGKSCQVRALGPVCESVNAAAAQETVGHSHCVFSPGGAHLALQVFSQRTRALRVVHKVSERCSAGLSHGLVGGRGLFSGCLRLRTPFFGRTMRGPLFLTAKAARCQALVHCKL